MAVSTLQKEIRAMANPAIAEHSLRFFKTGKGQYGEGDKFLGVRVPVIRALARQYRDMSVVHILVVLRSAYHEERLLALIMLVNAFKTGDDCIRKDIYESYLAHTDFVNGWDLVDSSAHQIVGGYLLERERSVLLQLAQSVSIWERRIAIMATLHFIKRGQFNDTLLISKQLLNDEEDLIHKAVGWMLREVGNLDREVDTRLRSLMSH